MSARENADARARKDTRTDGNTVLTVYTDVHSVKMKSYKNVITAVNCQRQVAFSEPSEMFPCGSRFASSLFLPSSELFHFLRRNAARNLIERHTNVTLYKTEYTRVKSSHLDLGEKKFIKYTEHSDNVTLVSIAF